MLRSVDTLGIAPACLQYFSKNRRILSVFSGGISANVHIFKYKLPSQLLGCKHCA